MTRNTGELVGEQTGDAVRADGTGEVVLSAELDLFVADSPVGGDQTETAVVASDADEVSVNVVIAKVDLADTRVEDEGSIATSADSGC